MENNNYFPVQEEVTIDLKDLFFYVLRKWKIIVALILVGALLGGIYAVSQKSNMSNTYVSSQSYFVASDSYGTELFIAKISALVQDNTALDTLRAEFALQMQNDQLRKMITIEPDKVVASSSSNIANSTSVSQFILTVTSDNNEECQAVTKAVDQLIENYHVSYAQEHENFYIEKIYENMETTTSKTNPNPIKYGMVGAVVLSIIAFFAYIVLYVFSGSVKTTDELRNLFSLYPIAQLAANPKKQGSVSSINSRDYLLDALHAMKLDNPLFCGDMSNAKIAEMLEWLASQDEQYNINSALAVEGQLRAVDAGSIILVIQLWKTHKDALKREMEICNKLDKKIAGVVVLK